MDKFGTSLAELEYRQTPINTKDVDGLLKTAQGITTQLKGLDRQQADQFEIIINKLHAQLEKATTEVQNALTEVEIINITEAAQLLVQKLTNQLVLAATQLDEY